MEPASSSLSTLAKPLISVGQFLAKALMPHIRQLHAERRAGREFTPIQTDFLDTLFEETLNRLARIEANDAWWCELLQRTETAYVRPDYLAKPSIREWLSEAAVRGDFRSVARSKLIPTSLN